MHLLSGHRSPDPSFKWRLLQFAEQFQRRNSFVSCFFSFFRCYAGVVLSGQRACWRSSVRQTETNPDHQKNSFGRSQIGRKQTARHRIVHSVCPTLLLADPTLPHQQHQDEQSGRTLLSIGQTSANSQTPVNFNFEVIDTSHLIKNVRDIFSSQKVACLLNNDQLHNMMVSSAPNSVLRRMYERTKLRTDMVRERQSLGSNRCLITRQPAMIDLFSSNIFILGERKMAALFATASSFIKGVFNRIWLNEKESSIFEFNQVKKFD